LRLQITSQERRALILPPGRHPALPATFEASECGLDLLVLPAGLAASEDLSALLARLQPRRLLIYGEAPAAQAPKTRIPCYFTGEGAVSVSLAAEGVRVSQWGH
jgi:hypothetical protein